MKNFRSMLFASMLAVMMSMPGSGFVTVHAESLSAVADVQVATPTTMSAIVVASLSDAQKHVKAKKQQEKEAKKQAKAAKNLAIKTAKQAAKEAKHQVKIAKKEVKQANRQFKKGQITQAQLDEKNVALKKQGVITKRRRKSERSKERSS
jgi:hypothetical protein